nr:hypothetical protein [Streptomyces brevispora]
MAHPLGRGEFTGRDALLAGQAGQYGLLPEGDVLGLGGVQDAAPQAADDRTDLS